MSTGNRVLLALAVGTGVAVGAYGAHWVAERQIAALTLSQTQAQQALSAKAVADLSTAVSRVNAVQAALATLDNHVTGELAHAWQENRAARRAVGAGRVVVQLDPHAVAGCQRARSAAAGAGRVGDATQIRLTADAGQAVLALRAGLLSDQAKVDYLQRYLRVLQKAGVVASAEPSSVNTVNRRKHPVSRKTAQADATAYSGEKHHDPE